MPAQYDQTTQIVVQLPLLKCFEARDLGNSFKALPHSCEYLKYLHLWKDDVIYGNSQNTWSQVWQGGQEGNVSLELPILDKSAVRVFSAMTGLVLSVKIKQFIILSLQ